MDLQITKAAAWIQNQKEKYPFAEISIKMVMHDGKIKRIEKTVVEKEQVEV